MTAANPDPITEYLALLEAERRAQIRADLGKFCRYIEIPGAPVIADTCPAGDDCDDPTCTGHEISTAFYPDNVRPAAHHDLINSRLQQVAAGTIKRLMIFCPPGSAKSTYASVTFPPWFMGNHPGKNIISTSYGTTLARKFGRRVRSICEQPAYAELYGTRTRKDNRAVDDWSLDNDATYMAGGILSGITGNRADGLIIDDPVKGHEQADSATIRDKTWDAYLTDLRTRLKPQGFIIIIQCMTGDTPVLMADGTERRLDALKIGDAVATYRNGKLSTSNVSNSRSNGNDCIYKITTTAGKIVRANGRHPFLVSINGELQWVRTRALTTGHKIVAFRASGASGKGKHALQSAATSPPSAKATACRTTTNKNGRTAIGRLAQMLSRVVRRISSIVTALPPRNTTACMSSKGASAPSAMNPPKAGRPSTGASSYASTTATTAAPFAPSCATPAISPSDTLALSAWHKPCSISCDFTLDSIAKVEPDGSAEVFDIQVDETENFIANGLVSHNTRWHEDDLSGRILPQNYDGESGPIIARDGETWEVVCLQAQAERHDDPLGRAPGDWLWTEWFTPAHWQRERRIQGERNWAALYQQRPKPADGALIKRAWPKRYTTLPAEFIRVVQSWDTAYKDTQYNDPSVCTTWGETRTGRYLLHVFRDKMEYPALKRAVASLAEKWKPDCILIEDKASGQSLIQEMRAGFSVPVIAIDTGTESKTDRLVATSSQWEAGLIYLPEQAPWLMDFESELFGFPLTTHDDQVDSASQALAYMHGNSGRYEAHSAGRSRAALEAEHDTQDITDRGYGSIGNHDQFRGFF